MGLIPGGEGALSLLGERISSKLLRPETELKNLSLLRPETELKNLSLLRPETELKNLSLPRPETGTAMDESSEEMVAGSSADVTPAQAAIIRQTVEAALSACVIRVPESLEGTLAMGLSRAVSRMRPTVDMVSATFCRLTGLAYERYTWGL